MSALARAPELPFALDVERAAARIAELRRVDEVKDIADKAAAVRGWLRAQRASLEAQNDAAEIMIRAQRRAGELLREMPKAEGSRREKRGGSGGSRLQPPAPTLADQGIEKTAAARWQKLAAVPEPVFEQHVTAVRARAEKLTTSGAIAATSHVETYDSDEWYTPPEYVEAAREVLGEIDLDPASCEVAQRTVRAKRWWSKADDALGPRRAWAGRVWMNPPYSAVISKFVARLILGVESGDVTAAVVLTNACTDTAWWHDLTRRGAVCVTRGRLAFLDPTGKPVQGNRVGQSFFCLSNDDDTRDRFLDRFAEYGLVGELRGPDGE